MNLNRDDCMCKLLVGHLVHSQAAPDLCGEGTRNFSNAHRLRQQLPLSITHYLIQFLKNWTSGEICVGVVKGARIFPKNPAQHAADLKMVCTRKK